MKPDRRGTLARQKEAEQSAGLPFCTDTKASHIAERELKDPGSRRGEGRRSGSAAGTASWDLSKGHVHSAGLEAACLPPAWNVKRRLASSPATVLQSIYMF